MTYPTSEFVNNLGQNVIINTTSGVITVKAIFNRNYSAVNEYGLEIENKNPYLITVTTDIAAVQITDVVEINSAYYQVISIDDDGTGMTKIRLSVDGN